MDGQEVSTRDRGEASPRILRCVNDGIYCGCDFNILQRMSDVRHTTKPLILVHHE